MTVDDGLVVGVIPARLGSSRFPGKPLALINGVPMIGHCCLRSREAQSLDLLVVATCDEAIADYAATIGIRAVMTSTEHETASDRAAEAIELLESEGHEVAVVVMIQGDEPLVRPEMIDAAVEPVLRGIVDVSNLVTEMSASEALDRNEIKVVMNDDGDALFMSRLPIPFDRDGSTPQYNKQVCVIPFRRSMLATFNGMDRSMLERAESIDMLRLVERGHSVRMVSVDGPIQSVDTIEDLQVAAELLRADDLARSYSI